MNKLYAIHYYLRGIKYSEYTTFFQNQINEELGKLGCAARLIESNEIHDIYRVDA